MNISCFFILQNIWGGRSVLVLSLVLFLNLQVLGQFLTFCILLMRVEPMLHPDVYPIEQMDWFSFWSE